MNEAIPHALDDAEGMLENEIFVLGHREKVMSVLSLFMVAEIGATQLGLRYQRIFTDFPNL